MFGLFKKKQPLPTSDQWSVLTAEDNGIPLIVRVRAALPVWCTKSTHNCLMGISWEYESRGGMPDPSVNQAQQRFEDILERELEGTETAAMTVVVTGNNVKEWQLYTHDPEGFMGILNTVLPQDRPLPLKFSCESDPKWEGYNQFKSKI